MFKDFGIRQGMSDGMDDASFLRREHPRPNLSLSVLSTGYRDAYLAAYHRGFRMRDPAIFDRHADPNNKPASLNEWAYRDLPYSERHRAMEKDFATGWKEAMAGKQEKIGQPPAYGRGYKIGLRDHEYALVKDLRMGQFNDRKHSAR